MNEHHADAWTLAALASWVLTHVAEINAWLQLLVLLVALISGCWSLWLRWKHRHARSDHFRR
jgi:Flp pilus assembly protein TadB